MKIQSSIKPYVNDYANSKGNNQGISKIRDFIESAESLGHDRSKGLNIHLHYILSNRSPIWFAQ